jgi:hypothetical protein
MRVKVEQGKRYRATLKLEGFQLLADNDTIREYAEQAGLSEVTSVGSGEVRIVTGVWTGESGEFEMPVALLNFNEV